MKIFKASCPVKSCKRHLQANGFEGLSQAHVDWQVKAHLKAKHGVEVIEHSGAKS